jgi:hypothetical protein
MKLLGHSLTEIIENISGDLSKVEQQAYYRTVITASKNKDLSAVGWAFLESELKELQRLLPQMRSEWCRDPVHHIQGLIPQIEALIEQIITDMKLVASGDVWQNKGKVEELVNKVTDRAFSAKERAKLASDLHATHADTTYAATFAKDYAVADVIYYVTYATYCATHAAVIITTRDTYIVKAIESAAHAAVNRNDPTNGASNGSYIQARQRQRDGLLTVLQNAPTIKDTQS